MNRKQLKVTITLLGKSENFTDDKNSLSSSGLRVSFNSVYGYGAVMPSAQIRIYGLPLETMNKLFRVRWNTLGALKNMIKVEAGEQGKQLIKVFEGSITEATIDFSGAPDVSLVIRSQSSALEYLLPKAPVTYSGQRDAADIIKVICEEISYQFENNGATARCDNVTLEGTALGKIRSLCDRHSFDLYIEQGLVSITQKNGSRNIKVPVITPKTGLIGYPEPNIRGVSFKCFYDPLLKFGGLCKIKDSIVENCNGDWRIYGMQVHLESNTPNGNWFSEINATRRDSKDAAIQR